MNTARLGAIAPASLIALLTITASAQGQGTDSVVVAARLGWAPARWEVQAVVHNLFDRAHATFGTFNINQGAGGAVERFLTPGQPRSVRLVVRHRF